MRVVRLPEASNRVAPRAATASGESVLCALNERLSTVRQLVVMKVAAWNVALTCCHVRCAIIEVTLSQSLVLEMENHDS
jgi:hypothetical protein